MHNNNNKWSKSFDKKAASLLYMAGSIIFTRLRQQAPHLTCASLGSLESTPKATSRSVQPFLHSPRKRVRIYYNETPLSLKINFAHGEIWIPSNTCFLVPTRVLNPNSISIGSAVFAGLITVTDRQTTLLAL